MLVSVERWYMKYPISMIEIVLKTKITKLEKIRIREKDNNVTIATLNISCQKKLNSLNK